MHIGISLIWFGLFSPYALVHATSPVILYSTVTRTIERTVYRNYIPHSSNGSLTSIVYENKEDSAGYLEEMSGDGTSSTETSDSDSESDEEDEDEDEGDFEEHPLHSSYNTTTSNYSISLSSSRSQLQTKSAIQPIETFISTESFTEFPSMTEINTPETETEKKIETDTETETKSEPVNSSKSSTQFSTSYATLSASTPVTSPLSSDLSISSSSTAPTISDSHPTTSVLSKPTTTRHYELNFENDGHLRIGNEIFPPSPQMPPNKDEQDLPAVVLPPEATSSSISTQLPRVLIPVEEKSEVSYIPKSSTEERKDRIHFTSKMSGTTISSQDETTSKKTPSSSPSTTASGKTPQSSSKHTVDKSRVAKSSSPKTTKVSTKASKAKPSTSARQSSKGPKSSKSPKKSTSIKEKTSKSPRKSSNPNNKSSKKPSSTKVPISSQPTEISNSEVEPQKLNISKSFGGVLHNNRTINYMSNSGSSSFTAIIIPSFLLLMVWL